MKRPRGLVALIFSMAMLVQAQSFLSAGLPQDKKSGRHQEPDYEFSWEIEYLESRGHTV
ncbi:MAG: hypothetical protein HY611_05655, partial [Elusimicrobia bacterium]|nr:hypothetical protein [Elusimicrobiota bacterium]